MSLILAPNPEFSDVLGLHKATGFLGGQTTHLVKLLLVLSRVLVVISGFRSGPKMVGKSCYDSFPAGVTNLNPVIVTPVPSFGTRNRKPENGIPTDLCFHLGPTGT